jgi:hypothetical protein
VLVVVVVVLLLLLLLLEAKTVEAAQAELKRR